METQADAVGPFKPSLISWDYYANDVPDDKKAAFTDEVEEVYNKIMAQRREDARLYGEPATPETGKKLFIDGVRQSVTDKATMRVANSWRRRASVKTPVKASTPASTSKTPGKTSKTPSKASLFASALKVKVWTYGDVGRPPVEITKNDKGQYIFDDGSIIQKGDTAVVVSGMVIKAPQGGNVKKAKAKFQEAETSDGEEEEEEYEGEEEDEEGEGEDEEGEEEDEPDAKPKAQEAKPDAKPKAKKGEEGEEEEPDAKPKAQAAYQRDDNQTDDDEPPTKKPNTNNTEGEAGDITPNTVPKVCAECKKKKTKCSKGVPCKRCKSLGIQCLAQ